LRIAYLVHNLADPGVGTRVRMLAAFGDEVIPIGFHRDDKFVDKVAGVDAFDLGRTFDRNFGQRIAMVLKQCVRLRAWAGQIHDCDVLMARNLEMLVLAVLSRWRYASHARLVYECLDIHRLLWSRRIAGRCMRALERLLLRKTDLLVVSSGAFLREYFEPMHDMGRSPRPPVLVVENKLLPALSSEAGIAQPETPLPPGPPWRIGWFGMIRCRKSLDLLCDLASRRPDLVQLTIRGRPSRTEFADFDRQVERTRGVCFGGPYRPAELCSLYRAVHFNWAIDYFEEGANSRWLLPNRLYEGGAYHAVPIALDNTETARWLRRAGIGVQLASGEALEAFLSALTPAHYGDLKRASRAAPRDAFIADERDCARLLDALGRASVHRTSPVSRLPAIELDLRQAGEARDDAAM
jgi:succinoglycan biosynthesis protein ExoL